MFIVVWSLTQFGDGLTAKEMRKRIKVNKPGLNFDKNLNSSC
jgi:hypothetical protein